MTDQVAPTPGFCGRLPACTECVRVGLSEAFTTAWGEWLAGVLFETRERFGVGWQAAWQAAPAWRFALSAGVCGPHAVVGIWMPSGDAAGRHFPLTIAAEVAGGAAAHLAAAADAWLAGAERAGRAAVASGWLSATLSARIPAYFETDADEPFDAGSLWWTEGAARVDAQHFSLATLPTADQFYRMLAGAEM